MRKPKVKPGSHVRDRQGDVFCVLMVDDSEVLMHRIQPEPSPNTLYTRHVRWSDFRRHGYRLMTSVPKKK